jgi:hypothetical protein
LLFTVACQSPGTIGPAAAPASAAAAATAAPRSPAAAPTFTVAPASAVGEAPPTDVPTNDDLRASLTKLGYKGGIFFKSVSVTLEDAAGPDKRTASLSLSREEPSTLKGGASKAIARGYTITALVKNAGKVDKAGTTELLDALVAGVGKSPRPYAIIASPPPAWHITDLTTTEKMTPFLTRAGFEHTGGGADTNPGSPLSVAVNGTKGDVFAFLAARCKVKGLAELDAGEVGYFQGDCVLIAGARAKNDHGEPLPDESRKLLESVLSGTP